MNGRYSHATYLIRKKVLKVFGGAFHIFDPSGQVAFYAHLKAFKLKEDIRLYSGEDMTEELLNIKARNIIDFSAVYDIFDSITGEMIGSLKRKGLKSILKDEWIIMDPSGRDIGNIKEDSTFYAIIRRFITSLVPQEYICTINGVHAATFKQNVNPFVVKLSLDFSRDTSNLLDKRLGIAAGLLLCAIDGKQD